MAENAPKALGLGTGRFGEDFQEDLIGPGVQVLEENFLMLRIKYLIFTLVLRKELDLVHE